MNPDFWRDRRVFLTGHTGFKGSWLAAWLKRLGAKVSGYALAPDTTPNLFEAAGVGEGMQSTIADVRDLEPLQRAMAASKPEIVFHLAAQSLVRESYARPVETYATNVMGTVHLLEAVRTTGGVRAVVVVTSDKCYENREWHWAYREDEPMGGRDPYSSSKGCAELVTAAYRASFFSENGAAAVASARAGNVIGGGDWAKDRLIPDLIRAFAESRPAPIRNPAATRPWQHVLEPLHGYLVLAEALVEREGARQGWNFGPADSDMKPVREIADALVSLWGDGASWTHDGGVNPHEAMTLKLDSSRARSILGWRPALDLRGALQWIVEWHKAFQKNPGTARELMEMQLERYQAMAAA